MEINITLNILKRGGILQVSWFSDLANAYDKASVLIGKKGVDGEAPLLPLNHGMSPDVSFVVTLDGNGALRNITKGSSKISMPVTGKARSGKTPASHGLHEELNFITLDKDRRNRYLELLTSWSIYNKKVEAVKKYVELDTIVEDLKKYGFEGKGKDFICFDVEIPNDTSHIWEDFEVIKAWQKYFYEKIMTGEKELCYVTGNQDFIKETHPMVHGKAKLVSFPTDNSFITFEGRFSKNKKGQKESRAIGDIVSDKAHAMLKYLIATQAYRVNNQAVTVFCSDDGERSVNPFEDSSNLYDKHTQTEQEEMENVKLELGFNYAYSLKNALAGYKNNLTADLRNISVMEVDIALDYRLNVNFYQKMSQNQYIDRIISWHNTMSFWTSYKGKEKDDKYTEYAFVQAPSVDILKEVIFGKQLDSKGNETSGSKHDKKRVRSKMLNHIVNGVPLDRGWMLVAVNRVKNPFSYVKKDNSWDMYAWQDALKVTCAIVRKYYYDKGEEYDLKLDEKNTDRSYLFGRLLAIADKIESHARYLQEKKSAIDKRPTNAVRYKTVFVSKPMRTWLLIDNQLSPYVQRLNGAEWYQQQIDEIMDLLMEIEGFNDSSLNGKYLLGYSLQRMELRKINNKKEIEEAVKDDHE